MLLWNTILRACTDMQSLQCFKLFWQSPWLSMCVWVNDGSVTECVCVSVCVFEFEHECVCMCLCACEYVCVCVTLLQKCGIHRPPFHGDCTQSSLHSPVTKPIHVPSLQYSCLIDPNVVPTQSGLTRAMQSTCPDRCHWPALHNWQQMWPMACYITTEGERPRSCDRHEQEVEVTPCYLCPAWDWCSVSSSGYHARWPVCYSA